MNKELLKLFFIFILILFLGLLYNKNKKCVVPKIVWSYWDKDPPTSIVKMYEDNKNVLKGWDYKFLNEITLTEYCNPKEFPDEYKSLSPQHKADYIRLVLLKKYGGLWLDSSIIINSLEEINRMREKCIATESQLCVFSLGDETYLENWFIMAPTNSFVIENWFAEFDTAVRMGFKTYKENLFKNNFEINERIYKKGDSNVYLTQHACLQAFIQKNKTVPFTILVYKSEESMFKLQVDCDWKKKCVQEKYPSEKNLPFIKLRGDDRIEN